MDKWLRNINVVRVAALLIGILLWGIVHLDERVGKEPNLIKDRIEEHWIHNVNITVEGLDEEFFHLQSLEPKTTNIVLKGKTKDLAKVSTKDGNSRIVADLSAVSQGTNSIQLKAAGFPDGVQVVHMNPSVVNVVVEQVQKKEVPIDVRITGQPAEGYKVGEPIVNPSRVLVSAAESVLNHIESVRAVVDVTGANKAVKGEYKLVAIDTSGNEVNIPIIPAAASVEVPITTPYKTVPLQIRLKGTPPPGYSIASYRQSESQVTLYGPEDVLNRIDIYDALEIDLSEATEDIRATYELPLKEGIETIHPATVDVNVEIALSVSKTIAEVPIRFSGLNDDLITGFGDPDEALASVTVEGAPNQIASLLPEQIEIVVDVSNLPPGEHLRELKVNLPVFVKLKSIEPGRVTVIVREPTEETTAPPAPDVQEPPTEPPSEPPPPGDRPPEDEESSQNPPEAGEEPDAGS